MASARVPSSLGKTDALVSLAARAGLSRSDPYAADLAPLFDALEAAFRPDANAAFRFVAAATRPEVVQRTHFPPGARHLPPPVFCNVRPESFPPCLGPMERPGFVVAEVADGLLVQLARASVTTLADGRTILEDFSSRYARLLRFYDVDLTEAVAGATHIPGDALVLCDDIFPLNYSHWLADTLPRLAFLGATPRDLSVVVTDQDAPFKRETLGAFGIAPERIVELADFTAIRADRLLVPCDVRLLPHPAYKAAPWALDCLRSRLGQAVPRSVRRLYVSRGDAAGRRIVNEDALMRLLAPAGYERVTLAGRGVAEQAALFAAASRIVGMHGAGLTNVVFGAPGASLLEIFPASYGTPAFYLLAAGSGLGYGAFVAADVRRGSRAQVDDIVLDIADFSARCGALL